MFLHQARTLWEPHRLLNLALTFRLCSHNPMSRIDLESLPEATITEALLSAPGWARVGLAAPTETMREQAARELARAVLEGSGERQEDNDCDQLALGL